MRATLAESSFHAEPDFVRILSGEEEGADRDHAGIAPNTGLFPGTIVKWSDCLMLNSAGFSLV